MLKVDRITSDCAEQLRFPGSAANANCALRTLRRMLHKAEEWKMIGHAPKIKMMKEHGRHLRLDDEAEMKLMAGALACSWHPRNSSDQVRCKTGGLGISVEALRVRASEVNLQSLPKSAQQSGPSERAGSLLCTT